MRWLWLLASRFIPHLGSSHYLLFLCCTLAARGEGQRTLCLIAEQRGTRPKLWAAKVLDDGLLLLCRCYN
jgi:hypothetical protein